MEKTPILSLSDLPPIPVRKPGTHKYFYGHLLVIGGSIGYLGAPQLSAMAALRTGVGLATVALPSNLYFRFGPDALSPMFFPYVDYADLAKLTPKKTAILFGPGLDRADPNNREILSRLLKSGIPLVIDAGGLEAFHQVAPAFDDFSQVILTPHMGEAVRLLAGLDPDMNKERLLLPGLTLVLKGPTTSISQGKVRYLANRGNAGMAKAGVGDVLAGMIASLLAQGYSSLEAAKLGVYLHQSAALIAEETTGLISLTAEDIIRALPMVFQQLTTA